MTTAGPDRSDLSDQLQRWVGDGLISQEQADKILAKESSRPPAAVPSRGSLVAEALGYVGGLLVLIAASTLTSWFWSDLGAAGRLGVGFGATALMLVTGAVVPARRSDTARRIRNVTWLLTVALLALTLFLLLGELREGLALDPNLEPVLVAGVSAILAGALWWLHRTVFQQTALVAALSGTVFSATSWLIQQWPRNEQTWQIDGALIGLAIWGLGVVWMLLGWGGMIAARRAAYVLGGVAAIAGSVPTIGLHWGAALAIGTAVVLVVSGVLLRSLVLLGVGAVATLVSVPWVLYEYFEDVLAVAIALLICGVLLVAGGIVTAYRRRLALPSREPREGNPTVAFLAATIITAVVVATIALNLLGR